MSVQIEQEQWRTWIEEIVFYLARWFSSLTNLFLLCISGNIKYFKSTCKFGGSLSSVFFFSLHCSQSLEEVEGEGVARGTKEKARTAPTPQQLPPHLELEAAELPSGPLVNLPLCHHSTKCLHSTNHDGYRCLEQDTPHPYYTCLFFTPGPIVVFF